VTREGISAALSVVLTLLGVWSLMVVDPFGLLRQALVSFSGAGHAEAVVSRLHKDAYTQDTTNGAHPLESLRALESHWREVSGQPRFVLVGNSQTLTVLLAPQEHVSDREESTYPDLLITLLQSSGTPVKGYRLSAPNISYMEVLWYLHYLLTRPYLTPTQFIVQLNFETFRKTGIRDGMLELLQDPNFAAAIEAEARSPVAYAATFQQAIDRYRSQVSKESGTDTGAAASSRTGVIETHGIGSLFETKVRQVLDRSALFRSRATLKSELMDGIYFARVHLLGITPTTKRSIGGATLKLNVSSLERVGELCATNGIRLTLFNAPQNPTAPLYRTEQDRAQYRKVISDLANKYAGRFFDFEDSIPKDMWGVWIDGPDPIHFGRAAHRRMADLMFTAGLIAPRN
jgi:hypothetical protein